MGNDKKHLNQYETQPCETIVEIADGKIFTTSLIVARAFEKEHKDVLKAISTLDSSPKFNERNFSPVEYKDAKGEMRPAYHLTRDGFVFLAMGFTGKKAAAWKEKFLEAFNTMEKALKREPAYSLEEVARPSRRRCSFFKSREKISESDLDEVTSLLRMEAFVQGKTLQAATNRLCARMEISQLAELARCNLNEALHNILQVMFYAGMLEKDEMAEVSEEELRETLAGLMRLWSIESDYTDREILDYVCNRCDVDELADLHGERNLHRAILATWNGLANHVFKHRRW